MTEQNREIDIRQLTSKRMTSISTRSKRKRRDQCEMTEERELIEKYYELSDAIDAEARRQARVAQLKKMIAELPESPKPMSRKEEEKRIRELEDLRIRHNLRHENNKFFNITAEILSKNNTKCGTIDMTVHLKTDPTRIDVNKEAILVMVLIKGNEARIRTELLGDVDVGIIHDIQFEIPGSASGRGPATTAEAKQEFAT